MALSTTMLHGRQPQQAQIIPNENGNGWCRIDPPDPPEPTAEERAAANAANEMYDDEVLRRCGSTETYRLLLRNDMLGSTRAERDSRGILSRHFTPLRPTRDRIVFQRDKVEEGFRQLREMAAGLR